MPKIIKDADGKFRVSFKDSSGKTRKRALGVTNKEDAKRLVDEAGIAKLEHAAQAGNLTADVISMIVAGKRVSAKDVVKGWIEWRTRTKAASTVKTQEIALNQWLRELGAYGWPVTRFTYQHVDDFVNCEDAGKEANRHARLHAIRSFFQFATASAFCAADPSRLVVVRRKSMSVEQKEKAERIPFTPGEYKRIMSETEGFWRWATALSYWTGLRLVDVCCLEWASIRSDAILVFTRKDEDRIWLPFDNPHINPGGELQNIIFEMTLGCVGSKQYVFPKQRLEILDPSKRAKFSVAYTRLLNRLGIENKSFHCLRHSFATRLKKAGVSIEEIAVHLGHSSTKTSEIYAH